MPWCPVVVDRRLALVGAPLGANTEVGSKHVIPDRHVGVAEINDRRQELDEGAPILSDEVLWEVRTKLDLCHPLTPPSAISRA